MYWKLLKIKNRESDREMGDTRRLRQTRTINKPTYLVRARNGHPDGQSKASVDYVIPCFRYSRRGRNNISEQFSSYGNKKGLKIRN